MNALFWVYALGALAVSLPILFHLIRRSPQGEQVFSTLMFLEPSPPRLTRASRLDNLLLLLLRALALLLIAAAFMRPFFRQELDAFSNRAPGRLVAILLDTSASMRRPDLWEKTLEAARNVIDGLEAEDQVALLTFGDSIETVVPWPAAEQRRDPREDQRNQSSDTYAWKQALLEPLGDIKPGWGQSDLGTALVHTADQMQALRDDLAEGTRLQIFIVSDLQQGTQLDRLQEFDWPEDLFVDAVLVEPDDTSNASLRILANLDPLADDIAEPSPTLESGSTQSGSTQSGSTGIGDVSDNSQSLARNSVQVRIENAKLSTREQFSLQWVRERSPSSSVMQEAVEPIPVYVPPGESRVVSMQRTELDQDASAIRLAGDLATYDNACYVIPPFRETIHIVYVGTDSDTDPDGLNFYLHRAFENTAQRDVRIRNIAPEDTSGLADLAANPPELVVVAELLADDQWDDIDAYLEAGGTLLIALTSPEVARSYADWNSSADFKTPESSSATENTSRNVRDTERDYVMLGEIDFTHPVFVPFANPRYNDFTRIHFWQFQPIAFAAQSPVEVIARFDTGDPAIWEERRDEGRVFGISAGWRPTDSQLALSSKFVPLMTMVLQQAMGGPPPSQTFTVHEMVPLPDSLWSAEIPDAESNGAENVATENSEAQRATALEILKPDGSKLVLASELRSFDGVDQPGIYRVARGEQSFRFAANVSPAESRTDPMDVNQLEQLGVVLGIASTASDLEAEQRQEKDLELEARQRIWQWLLVAALAVLGLETWLAGRAARQLRQQAASPGSTE